MLETAGPLEEREQDIVLRIARKNLGRGLQQPERQNELFLRYLAEKIPEVNDLLYSNKSIVERASNWIPIETINRTAGDMQKGKIVIIGHENIKSAEKDRKPSDPKIRSYSDLTAGQKIIADVLIDFAEKKIPIDYAKDSTRLTLRCWKRQDKDLAQFLEDNSGVEWEANNNPNIAKAISCTRLRRFAEDEIRKEFPDLVLK